MMKTHGRALQPERWALQEIGGVCRAIFKSRAEGLRLRTRCEPRSGLLCAFSLTSAQSGIGRLAIGHHIRATLPATWHARRDGGGARRRIIIIVPAGKAPSARRSIDAPVMAIERHGPRHCPTRKNLAGGADLIQRLQASQDIVDGDDLAIVQFA